MPALILYLLKVNVALVLFYLAYHVALRRLTFYHLNRLFLMFGIVFSTVYPFIDLSELFADNEKIKNTYMATMPTWVLTAQTAAPTPEVFDLWQVPVYLFWAGVAVMLVRFILQFISLYKIHAVSEPAKHKSIGFRQVESISQAFSFWQTIYINPAKHKSEELESILRHELIHITGWHTIDVMLAELSTVFYWFNPGAWLMKKAVKENLEFIADQNVVNTGVDKKEYQYLLLKVVGATQPQIANQFNFPSLKRRIAMMNKMPSTRKHLLKFLAIVPVAAVLLLAFGNVSQLQANNLDVTGYTKLGPDIYIKKGPIFQSACWTAPNTLTITPINGGEVENYQLDNEQDIAAAIDKYDLYLPDNELYEKLTAKTGSTQLDRITTDDASPMQDSDLSNDYKAFLKRNPDVSRIYWTADLDKSNTERVFLIIESKSGQKRSVPLDDKKSVAIAEREYGKLPSAPATPPLIDSDVLPTPPPPVKLEETEVIGASQQTGERIIFPTDIDYYQNKENLPTNYRNFLKRNPSVEKVGWKLKGNTKPQVVVIRLKSGETETYDMKDAKSLTAAESKYGKLPALFPPPPPTRAEEPGTPPPPPTPAVEPAPPTPPAPPANEQLPPPPPPVRHNGPLIPGTGAKLVEDEKTITYVLWPGETTKREFEVAKNAFRESGFDLNFDQKYDGDKLVGIKITLKSDRKGSNSNAVYNTGNLDGLKESNNVIVVKANKQTGELIVGSTIAEK